ncbi:MAG: AMP-binding protein, partial [Gemmatimonadetes bacterium]|nr:AMP-binding protein [Gemmatimonadota bacterium]
LSFDIAGLELFLPLLTGARVVIASRETAADARLLAERIESSGATVLQATPATWRMLLADGWSGNAHLRAFCGGEALDADLVRQLRPRVAELWNLYGPTETTIWSTLHRVEADAVPPVGRPIANTRLYLLDAHLNPVPLGAAGELYIAGEGVARGYLHRPELTAERFLPEVGETGARMYRTGDLARYRADGEVEYVGRADFQVKIRGFRIELGEIEAALQKQPQVRQAVVVAREDVPGDRRLVAYLAVDGDLSSTELRSALRESLPEYMVPSAFVTLEALPLTPNGKVDRRALPAPEIGAIAGREYVAPDTTTEQILAGIWAEVLHVEQVGSRDHFFELGGHSLLATQVVSRVREAFGIDLPLRAIFEAAALADLARCVDVLRSGGATVQAPPLVRVPREGTLPLSFAQQRLWFLDQLQPGTGAYNMPAVLRLRGELDVGALRRSLDELVRRHETLRTRVVAAEGIPVQVIDAPAPVELRVLDLAQTFGAGTGEIERAVREEVARPFDLAAGPLLRAVLVRVAEAEHVAIFTVHHVVSDGWSMGVLTREVSVLYGAFTAGVEPALAPLPVQYADYAAWQREYLSGEVLDAQIAYWRDALAGVPPVLELPTDRPRPAVMGSAGASVAFSLAPETADALRALARREGATPYMALLAAWQVLLSRYTGQHDVSVGTPVAGRTRVEVEGLIGLFVNTLVLRTSLHGDPTVAEAIRRVRDAALGAHAHQDLPFERLVEALGVERSLAYTPLFQVMFTFQNLERGELRLGAVDAEPMRVHGATARFDLDLTLAESNGGIEGTLVYRTELFDRATVERMLEGFRLLLEGMTAAPERRLSELDVLGADDRRMLVEWNATEQAYSRERCIHELIAAQAALTPDAVAVEYDGESLTYAELDRLSGALAAYLRTRGVGAETRVGVLVERSPEMVVALLGVLKAGATYLPLDPVYPAERIGYILADAGTHVLLTQERLIGLLPEHGAEVVRLDTEWEQIQACSSEAVEVDPEQVAYTIYTSGST